MEINYKVEIMDSSDRPNPSPAVVEARRYMQDEFGLALSRMPASKRAVLAPFFGELPPICICCGGPAHETELH
jgi:hypothetical protein